MDTPSSITFAGMSGTSFAMLKIRFFCASLTFAPMMTLLPRLPRNAGGMPVVDDAIWVATTTR